MVEQTITIEQVLTDRNLLQAWYKVRANKGCAGIDRETIADFESHLMAGLALLRDEVIYETYRPRPLWRIHVAKKSGHGLRSLSIPTVRDRVLQTAVALILTPLFEAGFEECSYAYRPGRSVDMAVRRVERLRDQGFVWVVDADIHSFFDEIEHSRLLAEVKMLVQDPAVLRLIRMWLDADVVEEKRRFRLHKGLPQGSPLSPLLANLYLDQLDEAMLDKNLRLVRFADDFLILCRKKRGADKALEFTADVLKSLRLQLNPAKTRVIDFNQGFRFLGVEFVRSLAIKAKYPAAIPTTFDLQALAQIPAQPTSLPEESAEQAEASGPKSELALAFAEAGIEPDDFPDRVEQVLPLEPPVEEKIDQAPAELDPRLRTLYVLEHGYVLAKESERFVLKKRGKIIQRIPAIKVDQIMIFGNAQITTQTMNFCLQAKIPIYLLSGHGRFYGVIDGFSTDPVLLHRDQFKRADDPGFCVDLARELIRGKIANCRVILLRYARKRSLPGFSATADRLQVILAKLGSVTELDGLRGHEGTAARLYFAALSAALDPDWHFNGRTRQPPKDPVNAMLSYGYTLLYYNIYSFLRTRGLNPQVGFLHPIRAGHPALVSDMIEEFRAIIVDTVVLNLVFNRRLTPALFTFPDAAGKGCLLSSRARRLFIRELEKKMNAPIKHPFSGVQLDYRRCLEHQIHHLASVIQGREPQYRAMVLR
ncbi:MAG TPA: CRISPR-associated endonuclease Cas1 [Desulfobulbus sp.]|nr:CRISPR-associated endonuclease Cas1 [Desulfobulbus sp.]